MSARRGAEQIFVPTIDKYNLVQRESILKMLMIPVRM